MGPVLEGLVKRGSGADAPVFRLDHGKLASRFRDIARQLGVEKACLYQLRHGGASHDLLSKKRDKHGVMARGRWRTDSSLRRYAKPAAVQRLLQAVDPALVEKGAYLATKMRELLCGTIAPWNSCLPPENTIWACAWKV